MQASGWYDKSPLALDLLTKPMHDTKDQIAALEAEIERLSERAQRCRKIIVFGKVGMVVGGLLLMALLVGVSRSNAELLVPSITGLRLPRGQQVGIASEPPTPVVPFSQNGEGIPGSTNRRFAHGSGRQLDVVPKIRPIAQNLYFL